MKKLLLSLFSASAMICNAQSQTPDHTPYKWIGDVNGDGYVNVADNTYLSNIILTNTFEEVGYVGKDVYTKNEVNQIVNKLISRIEALEAKHAVEAKETYTINGVEYPMPEAVDLGLPSGTKWASHNIGASSTEDCGLFFSWGDIRGYNQNERHVFSPSNYIFFSNGGSCETITKYTIDDKELFYEESEGKIGIWYDEFGNFIGDNKTTLEEEDDAACVYLKNGWRMPTFKEIKELYTECKWFYDTVNGVNGFYVVGENGKQIFMPISTDFGDGDFYCEHWSSTLGAITSCSYCLLSLWSDSEQKVWLELRDVGRYWEANIRAVIK